MTEIKKRARPSKKVGQAENTFKVSATVDVTKPVKGLKKISNLNYDAGLSLKITDKVIVIKEGNFQDLKGEIISITEGIKLPFKIDLKEFGIWNFKFEDLKLA